MLFNQTKEKKMGSHAAFMDERVSAYKF